MRVIRRSIAIGTAERGWGVFGSDTRSFASIPVKKVAVWIEKTFSVSEPRRAGFMACKRGESFEIGADEGRVRERNLKAEDVGGPWAATDIGGIQ